MEMVWSERCSSLGLLERNQGISGEDVQNPFRCLLSVSKTLRYSRNFSLITHSFLFPLGLNETWHSVVTSGWEPTFNQPSCTVVRDWLFFLRLSFLTTKHCVLVYSKGPGDPVRAQIVTISLDYQEILNTKLLAFARTIKTDNHCVFQLENNPNMWHNRQKWFTRHKNQLSLMPVK